MGELVVIGLAAGFPIIEEFADVLGHDTGHVEAGFFLVWAGVFEPGGDRFHEEAVAFIDGPECFTGFGIDDVDASVHDSVDRSPAGGNVDLGAKDVNVEDLPGADGATDAVDGHFAVMLGVGVTQFFNDVGVEDGADFVIPESLNESGFKATGIDFDSTAVAIAFGEDKDFVIGEFVLGGDFSCAGFAEHCAESGTAGDEGTDGESEEWESGFEFIHSASDSWETNRLASSLVRASVVCS